MPISSKKYIKNVIAILVIIALGMMGCASSSVDSDGESLTGTNTGTIKGKVIASSSISYKASKIAFQETIEGTTGVPGATCSIEGTDRSAITDENGFFQISDVAPGNYIIICKKSASDGKVYAFLKIVEVTGQTNDLGTIQIKETGNIQGKATLTDQTDHTGISVYVPGTSLDASTDAIGNYLIKDVPEGAYKLLFEKNGYTSAFLNNINVISGETVFADDMTLNLSTGATGSLTIENGRLYSNSRTVTVSIGASDEAVLYQISENPNFIGSVWNPIPTSRTWVFDSDGDKRLYIKFADANGLESAPISDSIIIDTTPPSNGTVIINNGALATNSTTVTLILSVADAATTVSQMKIGNAPDLTDSSWETFTIQRSWTIPAGDGAKNVYVQFRDVVGNETAAVSASIILDTAMPVSPSISIQEGAYTNNSQIHLNLSASGASLVKISENPDLSSVTPIPYTQSMLWNLSSSEGSKTIYAVYVDDAGNKTTPVSDSIISDTTPPTTPVIFNKDQTTNQTTFIMTLSAGSTDSNFANYQLKGGQYSDWTDTPETAIFSFTLTQQGTNILSIRGKDRAGNTGDAVSVIITLDTNAPILSDISADAAVTYVTITWKTSEPTTGKVDLGLNEDYGTTVEDSNLTTNHSVVATGLTGETIYYYRITSTDSGGNITLSTDLTFTTLKVKAITAGGYHTFAFTTSGQVKSWGSKDLGQLGRGDFLTEFTIIAPGVFHSCGLTASGGVKCWGSIINGQLIGGKIIYSLTPVDVVGLSTGVIAISAGSGPSCALTAVGGVKCWGNIVNGYSYIDGTISLTSVDIGALATGVIAIDVGEAYHSCALTTVGGVKCWGRVNDDGQLGDGTTIASPLDAVDVVDLSSGVIDISAGSGHTCALTDSGAVKCWGLNDLGRLGDGTTTNRLTPVDVIGLSSGVIGLSAGGAHTCALTSSGAVKCWGNNDYGQLGDGTTTDRLTPVDVVGLSSGVISISAGGSHSCALTASGTVKCWGFNGSGQLGDGTIIDHLTPVDVSGLH